MKEKLLFVHGYGTSGDEMTWMHNASQLVQSIYEIKIPNFPNSSKPVFAEWQETLLRELEDWTETDQLTIVAHSLGASFIMMLANRMKFKKLIAVAPGYVGHISREEYYTRSSRDLESKDSMYSFFEDGGKIQPEQVLQNIGTRILIYSDDDPNIKQYTRDFFEQQIQWDENISLTGYGHFMTRGDHPVDNFNELVELLEP